MKVWLPLLKQRLEDDPERWRPLLNAALRWKGHFGVPIGGIDADSRKLLLEMAADPKYGSNATMLIALKQRRESDQEVQALVKKALLGDDTGNALTLLMLLGFMDLDEFPEQLDLLFHEDAEIRRAARTTLVGARFGEFEAIADHLLKILDDPERKADHADAIRALAVLQHSHSRANEANAENPGYSKATYRKVWDVLKQISQRGPVELLPSALVALGGHSPERAREYATSEGLTDERKAELETAFAEYHDELKRMTNRGD
jgi:hypothetical protein